MTFHGMGHTDGEKDPFRWAVLGGGLNTCHQWHVLDRTQESLGEKRQGLASDCQNWTGCKNNVWRTPMTGKVDGKTLTSYTKAWCVELRAEKKNAGTFRYLQAVDYLEKYTKSGVTKEKIHRSGGANDEEDVGISENRNRVVQLETTEQNGTRTGTEDDPKRDIEPKRRQQDVQLIKREEAGREGMYITWTSCLGYWKRWNEAMRS